MSDRHKSITRPYISKMWGCFWISVWGYLIEVFWRPEEIRMHWNFGKSYWKPYTFWRFGNIQVSKRDE